jgi:hypothetical protein
VIDCRRAEKSREGDRVTFKNDDSCTKDTNLYRIIRSLEDDVVAGVGSLAIKRSTEDAGKVDRA